MFGNLEMHGDARLVLVINESSNNDSQHTFSLWRDGADLVSWYLMAEQIPNGVTYSEKFGIRLVQKKSKKVTVVDFD